MREIFAIGGLRAEVNLCVGKDVGNDEVDDGKCKNTHD